MEIVEAKIFKIVDNGKGKSKTILPNGGFKQFCAEHGVKEIEES